MRKLLAALLLLVSCQESPSQFTGTAMTIPYRIIVDRHGDQAEVVITETFELVDQIFNNWNPDSEISRFNQLRAHVRMTISEELDHFLTLLIPLIGLYDPAYGTPGGWHLEDGVLWKEHDETALDLGGSAKGHAVDLLVERLSAMGCKSIFVSWGGEIRVQGLHPSGRPWRVATEGGVVEMTDGAIATSGNTYQDGHIYSPLTLSWLKGDLPLATVKAPTCLEADVKATAQIVANNL